MPIVACVAVHRPAISPKFRDDYSRSFKVNRVVTRTDRRTDGKTKSRADRPIDRRADEQTDKRAVTLLVIV